jgi:hypothetical protein
VRSLPAGARAEVSVLLIDEAGLASVDVSRSARVR